MEEPNNLVLEHLRAIRGDMAKMAKMADAMRGLSVGMTAMRQQFAGVATLQDYDHTGRDHQDPSGPDRAQA